MFKKRLTLSSIALATALAVALTAHSSLRAEEDEAADESQPAPRTLVTNLENPSGLAIHPETGDVFIASRHGIYRYDPGSHKIYLEVTGFPTDIYGKGPRYNIGPLGLAFMDNEHLVVGDGSRPDGEELVRVYKFDAESRDEDRKPANEDSAAYTLGPIEAGEESNMGEGNFYGVAVGAGSIFITCNGDDTKGWVSKIDIDEEGKPGELKPYIATKVATDVNAPVPITFTPDGEELVVGQMGAINLPEDSLLTFYDPKTGELKRSYELGLHDPTGLAYSPTTGNLYVLDFAWIDTSEGGLFRVDIEGDEVTTEKILGLDKPTSLTFDQEGRLYITVIGTQEEESEKSPGAVLVLEPGL